MFDSNHDTLFALCKYFPQNNQCYYSSTHQMNGISNCCQPCKNLTLGIVMKLVLSNLLLADLTPVLPEHVVFFPLKVVLDPIRLSCCCNNVGGLMCMDTQAGPGCKLFNRFIKITGALNRTPNKRVRSDLGCVSISCISGHVLITWVFWQNDFLFK